jgi:hypothetical protein
MPIPPARVTGRKLELFCAIQAEAGRCGVPLIPADCWFLQAFATVLLRLEDREPTDCAQLEEFTGLAEEFGESCRLPAESVIRLLATVGVVRPPEIGSTGQPAPPAHLSGRARELYRFAAVECSTCRNIDARSSSRFLAVFAESLNMLEQAVQQHDNREIARIICLQQELRAFVGLGINGLCRLLREVGAEHFLIDEAAAAKLLAACPDARKVLWM